MSTATDPIKVYDARWELDDFTPLEIRRFIDSVLFYGHSLGVDTVTIARDTRLGCGMVMEMAVEAAVAAGFTVYLCTAPISTPQSYFLSFWVSEKNPHTMGLTITASHNPANYVGLKVVLPGVRAIGLGCGPEGGFGRIRDIYHGSDILEFRQGGKLRIVDPTERYIQFSMNSVGVEDGELHGLRVVLDAMNGSAGPEMFTALHRAGVTILPLRLIPDGTFPSGSPNPTSRNKMDQAIKLAAQSGSVVIGTDGDGDRLVFGDGRGIWDAGFVSIPILKNLLTTYYPSGSIPDSPPRVIYDPKINPTVLTKWADLGIEPTLFGNGHSQIKEQMRRIDALAAFEESGHYYHKVTADGSTVYAENSLITIFLFLKALKAQPEQIDQLWTWQSRIFSSGEINCQLVNDETRDRVLIAIKKHFRDDGAELISKTEEGIDLMGTVFRKGVDLRRIELGDAWYSGYMRVATNEKSVVRFYLSAGDAKVGRKIEQRIKGFFDRFRGRIIE